MRRTGILVCGGLDAVVWRCRIVVVRHTHFDICEYFLDVSARFHPVVRAMGAAAAATETASILASFAATQPVAAQEVLFHEGDEARSLFKVVSGVMRLYRLLPDGRRSVTGFAFPGTVLGLSMRDAYIYNAEAVTPSEICRCGRGTVTKLLDTTKSDLRHRLLTIVSDELCAAQDQMVLLRRKSAPERLVSFLLWVAEKMHGNHSVRHIDLPMSRTDTADYLGLTTETVSRELTKLRQAGLISVPTPQRIHFLRPDVLREMAENGEAEIKMAVGRVKSARWPR